MMTVPKPTMRSAAQWLRWNLDRVQEAFREQYPHLPNGRLHNPRIVGVSPGEIELRCHYDNYDNDDDSWSWYLDPATMRFHN